jgi:UDP-N-acetylglucosamine 2-epimerase
VTERPEVVDAGAGKVIGTDCDHIVPKVVVLMQNPVEYQKMIWARNPFGDGHAAERIVNILARLYSGEDHRSSLESARSQPEFSRSVVYPEFRL